MNFLTLLNKLEKYENSDESLQDIDVSANKIKGISFLIFKNGEGKVIDSIILKDHNYDPKSPCVSDDVDRRVCLK